MKRYAQQTILPEVGLNGQEILKNSNVLVVGCGGLGVPLITYLSAMGVGHITIIDSDIVEHTNLHRQFAFTQEDFGKNKANILSKRIKTQNPECTITPIAERFNSSNQINDLSKFDLICDCTDNIESRIDLNKTAIELNIPLVYGAVTNWTGYVTILNGKSGIQLKNLHPSIPSDEQQNNCSISGVLPSICGTIATIQATETIKILLKIPSTFDGAVFAYNGLDNKIQTFRLKSN